jgi:hypothetical protein
MQRTRSRAAPLATSWYFSQKAALLKAYATWTARLGRARQRAASHATYPPPLRRSILPVRLSRGPHAPPTWARPAWGFAPAPGPMAGPPSKTRVQPRGDAPVTEAPKAADPAMAGSVGPAGACGGLPPSSQAGLSAPEAATPAEITLDLVSLPRRDRAGAQGADYPFHDLRGVRRGHAAPGPAGRPVLHAGLSAASMATEEAAVARDAR